MLTVDWSVVARGAFGVSLAVLLLAVGASADDAATESSGTNEEARLAAKQAAIEADTRAVVERIEQSADYLAKQKRFRFSTRDHYEVLQSTGQMLEFGGEQTVTVRRPDRVRVEREDRDGDRRVTFFDGKTITVDLPEADAYVAVEKPGSLQAAVEYLVNDLDTPWPLHPFLTENYFDDVAPKVRAAFLVATELVGGRICDHVALQSSESDVQLWIQTGDEPLPCRLVITYLDYPGHPQFVADFESWDLAPEVPDELFSFTPPASAERLTFSAGRKEVREEKGLQ